MIEMPVLLSPPVWPSEPTLDPAPLVEQMATLRLESAALRAENVALRERIRDLEALLGQHSANSSRPPSADPPQAPVRPKAPPSGRTRGGQPGHRGGYRALLPVEQVDEIVAVVPESCRRCQHPFPETAGRRRGRAWRHQVVELLPLAVRVAEYQMITRRCPSCGKRTHADLPVGVPRRPFGPRLTAVVALLSGRCWRSSWPPGRPRCGAAHRRLCSRHHRGAERLPSHKHQE
jgi:transposase